MVGWCRLHVFVLAGSSVILRHAETLKPDGSLYMANLRGAQVTDVYTLKGGGRETWEPRFVTHGFRYVEMTGFPGQPTLKAGHFHITKAVRYETWFPGFVTHGFRYVEMTGFPGQPTLNSLEGRVVNDDVRTNGEFTCT